MTGLLVLLAAVAVVVAFCGGCVYTEWRAADALDPDGPGLLDAASGALCPYETVCPTDPWGHIEPCRLAAGHDGPHEHPHEWVDEALAVGGFDGCDYAAVTSPTTTAPCCLERGHAGPHLAALAIGADGYARTQT